MNEFRTYRLAEVFHVRLFIYVVPNAYEYEVP